MTELIQELENQIRKSEDRLKELESQDEADWTECKKMYAGKDVNIPLVKNHIIYYKEQIEKEKKQSLLAFLS